MKEKIKQYLKNILIGFDQLVNVIFLNGYPDETLSSHFYRWNRDGIYQPGTVSPLPSGRGYKVCCR